MKRPLYDMFSLLGVNNSQFTGNSMATKSDSSYYLNNEKNADTLS